MRELLTKQEVAELVDRSTRWVEINADQFGGVRSDDQATNGRRPMVFALANLPGDAQRKWVSQQNSKVIELPAETTPGQLALSLAMPDGLNMGQADRELAEQRYRIIEPLVEPERHRSLWIQCGEKRTALVEYLAAHNGTKPRTVYGWLKQFRDGGLTALVRKGRADKGRPRALNNAALDFILAAALPRRGCYGALSVKEIYRAYQEERRWRAEHADSELGEFEINKYVRYLAGDGTLRPDAQLPEASYETFRSWFNKIPDVVKVMAREGEEAFSNTQEIISFRDLSEVQPLDYLVMDHRRLDLFCLFPERGGWKLARPWLTAAIDMRTRKWVAWALVETPSSDSIASVLKRAFLDHGLWKAMYWDNGKDFRCEWLEGKTPRAGQSYKVDELDDSMRGVLQTLGIRVHHAIVKRARAKLIEPNFINTANFDKSLPWWCGHKPTARPERFAGLVEQHERWVKGQAEATPFKTIDEIAALYDEFIDTLNEREHTGEGMRKVTATGRGWMCPNECWERLIPTVEVRRAPAEVLQFCFRKRRVLKIRNGEIRPSFGGRIFHFRMQENPVQLMALNGREVEFAYDPHDLETAAIYCDGRFLGLASNAELRLMGEESFVDDEKNRRRARREVKRFINTVHKAIHVPDAQERAVRRMAVAPKRLMAVGAETEAAVPERFVAASRAAQAASEFDFDSTTVEAAPKCASGGRHEDGDDAFEFFLKEAT